MTAPTGSNPAPNSGVPLGTDPRPIWPVALHASGALAQVVSAFTLGVGAWLPPLVVWLLWLASRSRGPFVDDHGREALNFQLSCVLYSLLAFLAGILTCGVALPVTMGLVAVYACAGGVLAIIAASKGRIFRYPAALRPLRPAV